MSCELKTIENNNIKEVIKEFIGNGKHFKEVREGVLVGTPSSKFNMFQLSTIVESNLNRAQKWIDKKFKNNPKYTKNWYKVTENKQDIEIEFKIPKPLSIAWSNKLDQISFEEANRQLDEYYRSLEAENIQSEDAIRAGKEETPAYLFESKKDLSELTTASSKNQFGRESIPVKTEQEVRYDYSEEIKSTLFAGNVKNTTAKEVLQNILNSGIYNSDPKMLELIHRMLISTKANVKIVDSKELTSSDTYMQYDIANHTIELSLDNLGDIPTVEVGISKFLHEVYHDRTLRVLRTPKNITEQKLYDDIKNVYDVLKEQLNDEFPHEMSSLEEFTAGMFSNPKFEARVSELVNTKENFWDKLINFFRNLFRLDTSYDKLLNNIINLVDVTDQEYIGEGKLESKYNIGEVIFRSRKKLDNINDIIENTLENLTKTTQRLSKDSKFLNTFNEVKEEYKALLDKYEKDSNEYKLESIKILNDFISKQLYSAEKRLENKDDFNNKLYEQLRTYTITFNNLENVIKNTLKELKQEGTLSDEEFKKINSQTKYLVNKSNEIQDSLLSYAIEAMENTDLFSNEYKEVYLRYTQKYRQEGKEQGLTKDALDEYVNKKLSENRDIIKKETKDEWNDLISNPIVDISQLSAIANSEKDLNHPIIRVFSRILDNVKHAYSSFIQPKLLEIQDKTTKFLEGSYTKSSDEHYKNMVQWSNNDEVYLLGEYQIGYKDSFNNLMEKINNLNIENVNKLKYTRAKMLRDWFRENTVKDEETNTTKPHPKWKTDRSKLSQKENEFLDYMLSVAKESNNNYGIDAKSLKKTLLGAEFYKLPSQHKEMITHIKNGGIVKYGKEMFNDTFKLRTDDTAYGEQSDSKDSKNTFMVYTDISGKEIKYVPIHHRGAIEKKYQSIDLPTLYAVEYQNSVKFREKSKVSSDLNMFIDVISENKFIKKKGVGARWITGAAGVTVEYSKENANLLKMLETMMNNRIYDKTKEYLGKVGPVDVAKIEGFVRGITSQASMALNVISAPVNVITGKTQSLLENLRDPNLSLDNIKKAEKFFANNIGGTIDDLGRNVYKSLPNQLLFQYGGIMGTDILQNNFEKNKVLALTNTKWMYMMQEGGEHWIQSVHTMSILDSAKILDEKGNYLDKDGNITTKDKAASVLDISVVEKGNLTTSIKKPFYTTLDRIKEFDKGGNATIRSYIQTSLIKSQGNYSQEYQSEMQRHVLGTMLMHFKKHIISPGLSRWRGAATNIFANPEDIRLSFESDLQRVDEGNYVTWSRYMIKSFLPKVATLKLKLLTEDWNNMDDWEKGNIKKTMTEIAFIALVASSALLFAGAASDDDDDYAGLWYAAAITRRLQSDAMQYIDATEAWRILKNPISTINFLEKTTSVVGSLTNYITPFVEDRNTKAIKATTALGKLIPGHSLFTDPKKAYNFSNR